MDETPISEFFTQNAPNSSDVNLQSGGEEEEVFASTWAGLVLPSLTGSLSFISSSFIMITILRSKQNTEYHRILFCLSFWDSVVSFCIALSTLPMPSDVVYDYKGPSIGTTGTCELQAFLIFLGWGYVCSSNALLNIYYLCTIRYNISEEKFRKVAEPVFIILSSALSLASPIYFLSRDAFNPTPVDTFCAVDVYPRSCRYDPSECIHGKTEDWDETLTFYYFYPIAGIGTNFIILILSMILVVYTVFSPREELAGCISQKERRIIAIQACMYILACFLAWVFTVASFFVDETKTVATLKYIFTPLQGFFNLFIFIFQKLYTCTHCQVGGDLTLTETIRLIITSPTSLIDKTLVINIDIVDSFQAKKKPKLSKDEVPRNLRKRKESPGKNSMTDSKNKLFDDLEALQSFPAKKKCQVGDTDRDRIESKVDLFQSTNENPRYASSHFYTDPRLQWKGKDSSNGEKSTSTKMNFKALTRLRRNSNSAAQHSCADESFPKDGTVKKKKQYYSSICIGSRKCDHILTYPKDKLCSDASVGSRDLSVQFSSHHSSGTNSDVLSDEESYGDVESNASTIVTGVGSQSKHSKTSKKSREDGTI
ncbi:hypothetical protein CTEN210_03451 [Chaetoceros tenuissimus]|uniref:G-protein coupled receptors family 1 profile domain-containing protein n=1 Tax=Chaetoceros tenuissimus TaxID=426638 RepID=A0AAD3CJD7_9STRA|nr:hypothetical protein CTEN210_03451 [Chaetoceros tenuissimus]